MTEHPHYAISLDNRYGYLELIDVPELVAAVRDPWFNQTLTQVDGSVVRLGVVQGEFHWHHHTEEDEFFFVLDGELQIDLEGHDTVTLRPQQGFNVPKGQRHRTRAATKTTMLMMSAASVQPTGS